MKKQTTRDDMTVDEIKQAIHQWDLINRPCIIYLHPDDTELLKKALPDIEKKILIQSTPFVERGKGYLMERKVLEEWV